MDRCARDRWTVVAKPCGTSATPQLRLRSQIGVAAFADAVEERDLTDYDRALGVA